MNICEKTLLIIATIIILLISTVGLWSLYKTIKIAEAFKISSINTFQCDEIACNGPDEIVNCSFPKSININIWEKPIANFCASILYNIEHPLWFNKKSIYRKEIELVDTIDIVGSEVPLTFIFTSDYCIWLVFRGTDSYSEWESDLNYQQSIYNINLVSELTSLKLVSINNKSISVGVHLGFLNIYESVRDKIFKILQKINPNKNIPIVLTGHSMGSAVSTLCLIDLHNSLYKTICYNFASPRVGDINFSKAVDRLNLKLYRIVNEDDQVPFLPPSVSPNFSNPEEPYIFKHVGVPKYFSINWQSIINNHLMGCYCEGMKLLK